MLLINARHHRRRRRRRRWHMVGLKWPIPTAVTLDDADDDDDVRAEEEEEEEEGVCLYPRL